MGKAMGLLTAIDVLTPRVLVGFGPGGFPTWHRRDAGVVNKMDGITEVGDIDIGDPSIGEGLDTLVRGGDGGRELTA